MGEPTDEAAPQMPLTTSAIDAPITYVDSLYHVITNDGVAKLAWIQNAADASTDPSEPAVVFKARHALILAIPVPALLRAIDYLHDLIPLIQGESKKDA